MYIYAEEEYGQLERIKELMAEFVDSNGKKGMTQEKLALAIDVDKGNVNKWFKKGVKIRRSNLEKIAEVLNCDVEFLTCEQNYPRKNNLPKILLSSVSYREKYLNFLKELLKTKSIRFDYSVGWDITNSEIYTGTFVDGETRYYYEDIETEYGEMYYNISIDGGEKKRKTPEEMDTFINSIVKFISYEINQL